MNFLESIWLIPLFPLFGAVVMLFLGKKIDPQAPSELAFAPGIAPDHAGHGHGHEHHHAAPSKILVSILCPGMVLLSFLLSVAAVVEVSSLPEKTFQLITYTWLPGLPFLTQSGALARFKTVTASSIVLTSPASQRAKQRDVVEPLRLAWATPRRDPTSTPAPWLMRMTLVMAVFPSIAPPQAHWLDGKAALAPATHTADERPHTANPRAPERQRCSTSSRFSGGAVHHDLGVVGNLVGTAGQLIRGDPERSRDCIRGGSDLDGSAHVENRHGVPVLETLL